jgi:hypothetical protein
MRKNGCVAVGDTDMYYVAFGEGKRHWLFCQVYQMDCGL